MVEKETLSFESDMSKDELNDDNIDLVREGKKSFECDVCSHWDFELFSSSNHISPLLNRPQGCQGCQKNRKDLRFHT